MKEIRLQKIIADYGFCSRRKAEELILAGKVKVNDEKITKIGTKATKEDIIKINNKIINANPDKIYLALNKPRYILSTTDDPKQRKTVMMFFDNIKSRIYPIGRLDYDTSGLLLFTNDGEFANVVLHPKYEITKKYLVVIDGKLEDHEIKKIENGVKIEEDFITSKSKVIKNEYFKTSNKSYIVLAIHEGRYHQLKKMFIAINRDVEKLKRLEVGIVKLDNLKPGKYRSLSENEINFFKNFLIKEKE